MSKFNVPITSRKDKRDSAAEKIQLKFIKKFGGVLTQYLEDNIKGKK